jgi:hypothetical protein
MGPWTAVARPKSATGCNLGPCLTARNCTSVKISSTDAYEHCRMDSDAYDFGVARVAMAMRTHLQSCSGEKGLPR